ncbi:MAG: DUF4145 domain-containing protein [Syntrophales bacterium]|nr:DUF4145 domain-containing protein [Syntrophales bacterium]MDD5643157.1 DUF4145 domain-containing protein [Syntrophales bacterium]
MIPYQPPEYSKTAFNCPYCGVCAHQIWSNLHSNVYGWAVENLETAKCSHCSNVSIWYRKNLIFPPELGAPLPNSDLPDEIKADYEESRLIVSKSPRGAAALLRLAIQKLCKHLGEKGTNLNDDIGNLVKKGLSKKIQKALDIVRVIGNNAVHPGQIDLQDDVETANKLFGLINIIAEVMITQPKHVDEFYDSLPESQKEQISKRDNIS